MKNEVSPRLCAHRCLEKLFGKSSGVVGWRTLPSMKRSYQTDLTDAEWEALKPHLPAANKRGRPRIHNPREVEQKVQKERKKVEKKVQEKVQEGQQRIEEGVKKGQQQVKEKAQ